MLDFVQNSIASAIDKWITGVVYSFAKWILDWAVGSVGIDRALLGKPFFASAYGIVWMIAVSWITARATWEALQIFVLRQAGESHTDPQVWFRRVVQAVLGAALAKHYLFLMVDVAQATARLFGTPRLDKSTGQAIIENLLCSASGGTGVLDALQCGMGAAAGGPVGMAAMPVLLAVLFLLVFAVAVLVLQLQALARTWELGIAFVVGPLFAVSAMGTANFLAEGMFALWVREVAVLTLTQVVHTIILTGVMSHFISNFDISAFLAGLVGLYVAWSTPRILRNYVYSSGMGKMTYSVGMQVLATALSRTLW